MSTVVFVLSEVNVFVFVYLEATAFTHVAHPLAFVNTADLLTVESLIVLKSLFEVKPYANALFVFECAIELADVNPRLVVFFFQGESIVAGLFCPLVIDGFVETLDAVHLFAS